MGHETFVYGRLGGAAETVLHVPGHLAAQAGESLPVALVLRHLHAFNTVTGRRLEAAP